MPEEKITVGGYNGGPTKEIDLDEITAETRTAEFKVDVQKDRELFEARKMRENDRATVSNSKRGEISTPLGNAAMAPTLTPRQYLSIQLWNAIAFAAGNAVLFHMDGGDPEMQARAQAIVDEAVNALNDANTAIDNERGWVGENL